MSDLETDFQWFLKVDMKMAEFKKIKCYALKYNNYSDNKQDIIYCHIK